MKERMPIGFMFKQINTIYEKDFNQLLKTIGITASQCAVLEIRVFSAAVKNP